MHQQKCIINLLLHTLLFCNWVCFAGATYDALYPYSDKETWGGKMKIEDIRRRLMQIENTHKLLESKYSNFAMDINFLFFN